MNSKNTSIGLDSPLRGMVLAIVGMSLLPGMDAIAKLLGEAGEISPGFLTLARFGTQIVLSFGGALIVCGLAGLKPERFWINLLRGALIALASLLFFITIKYVPLADAIAIFFVEALILTLLSAVFLGERVGWRRVSAVVAGFIGALIVIEPNFVVLGPVSALPLGTAFLFAVYLMLNRVAGRSDNAWTMQFISGIGGFGILLVAIVAGEFMGAENLKFTLPTKSVDWWLIALMGTIGVVGHFLVVRGFQMAPASLLAPLQYFEIVAAAILGLLIFGEFPSVSKWIGIAIIVASGLFVLWRGGHEEEAVPNSKI